MQRLMHVTHKMQQEKQRDALLIMRNAGIFQLSGEFSDLVDDAILRRTGRRIRGDTDGRVTEASLIRIRPVEFEVDEVP
jgi:hypothetical protein